jgi:hypothetical protein
VIGGTDQRHSRVRASEGGTIWGLRLSRAVAELFGLRLQCRPTRGIGKGAGGGLDALRKRREGGSGRVGASVRWMSRGRGPGCWQWPGAAEADIGQAVREQEMERGPVGWGPPRRERKARGHAWNKWAGRGEGKRDGPEGTGGFSIYSNKFN